MDLMSIFRSMTGANQFAAPGQLGNFGDGLQGIGHSLAQWARYGQGETPAGRGPQAQQPAGLTPGMGIAPIAPIAGQPMPMAQPSPISLAAMLPMVQPQAAPRLPTAINYGGVW